VPLNRLVIYAGNVEETARFYEKQFGFAVTRQSGDRIVELVAQNGGASRRQKVIVIKLVFDVEDVEAFCRRSQENGLAFGPIHGADGYQFANTKDPCQNSVSVSSRAFRKTD
jgi:predicted enzyme related to lactoylglutathione lyase